MADWEHYFHFPTGTNFDIDGPFGFDGKGQVVERTPNKLHLRLDLDAWGPAPALHTYVIVEYKQEGAGNTVIVQKDGQPEAREDNAVINSNDSRRERRISSNNLTCSVRYDGSNEIDFDAYLNGQPWDFDFIRQ